MRGTISSTVEDADTTIVAQTVLSGCVFEAPLERVVEASDFLPFFEITVEFEVANRHVVRGNANATR